MLVRHGESEGNLVNARSRQGDDSLFTPEHLGRHSFEWHLTDRGIEQAKAAGRFLREEGRLPFDVCLTSEYVRAMETAAYLDGAGRQESKKLDRSAALAYATESMRLTTRLMQLASWLLLHRAVKEGEMSLAQANKEKTKVKLSLGDRADADTIALLPAQLRELIDRSLGLLERVRRLDATMHSPVAERPANNAVERQIGLLRAAFEREARSQ